MQLAFSERRLATKCHANAFFRFVFLDGILDVRLVEDHAAIISSVHTNRFDALESDDFDTFLPFSVLLGFSVALRFQFASPTPGKEPLTQSGEAAHAVLVGHRGACCRVVLLVSASNKAPETTSDGRTGSWTMPSKLGD